MKRIVLAFALTLSALPIEPAAADPELRGGKFRWFGLDESRAQVAALLGQPTLVADFGADYQSWQYQIGPVDQHDFTHLLVFRRSDGKLVSVTRNYEPARNVEAWFPPDSRIHQYVDQGRPGFSVRVGQLPGGLLLMAMGTSRAGQPVAQIMLIREGDVGLFQPWLAAKLNRHRPSTR